MTINMKRCDGLRTRKRALHLALHVHLKIWSFLCKKNWKRMCEVLNTVKSKGFLLLLLYFLESNLYLTSWQRWRTGLSERLVIEQETGRASSILLLTVGMSWIWWILLLVLWYKWRWFKKKDLMACCDVTKEQRTKGQRTFDTRGGRFKMRNLENWNTRTEHHLKQSLDA